MLKAEFHENSQERRSETARMIMTGAKRLWTIALVGALLTACGPSPERTLDVTPGLEMPASLPAGHPLDMRYEWTPASDFSPPADDYKVFVHIVDPEGNIVMQDDHYPPVPTSQWQPGETVSYQHWLYPHDESPPEHLDFYIGLYDGESAEQVKVPVKWENALNERPRVHRLTIRREDLSGQPVRVEGWHGKESPNPEQSWYWMERRSVSAFDNPRGPAILHLRIHCPVGEVGGAQTVTISVGDTEVTTLEVTDATPFTERIEVPASVMGDGDWIELTIAVDKWFVPAELDPESQDKRELGLQVFGLYMARASS